MAIRHSLVAAWLLGMACLAATDLPSEPMLRIETGFHTEPVFSVDASSDGRLLLSASSDRTLRTWRWDGRRLAAESVYRVPIGSGDEGRLQGSVLSLDGRWILAGGSTGIQDGTTCIYLIDRRSGRLEQRIGRVPGSVCRLRLAPDGSRVLACLGRRGVCCFSVPEGRLLWQDADYAAASFDGCWLPDGGCVTTCLDGRLRRYDAPGRLIRRVLAPDGIRPWGVDAAGWMLILGYQDRPMVSLLSAEDFRPVGRLDTAGISDSLGTVLAAHGRWWGGGGAAVAQAEHPLFAWSQDNGVRQRYPGPVDCINDLRWMPAGIVLGSSASLRVLDAAGRTLAQRDSDVCDLRGTVDGHFLVDPRGQRLWFGRKRGGGDPVLLDLTTGNLEPAEHAPSDLLPPVPTTPGLEVRDWKDTSRPAINSRRIVLAGNEQAHASAIPPTGQLVVLACDWSLRACGADSLGLWRQRTAVHAWGVNCPTQAPVVIAAYDDGTLRWHRLSDGAEVLACFPGRDGRRWIAWTPSGYYWAGPGGEDLIGWHLNRGVDQLADFYPASRFRGRFNRPDIIQAICETWDEAKAIELVARSRRVESGPVTANLPPLVEIIDPVNDSALQNSTVAVRLRLHAPVDDPVSGIRVLFDGQELAQQRGLRPLPAADVLTLTVTVPTRDGLLSVVAENRHGASSPASCRLRWSGAAAAPVRPACYVLAVGIGSYRDARISQLRFPGADAQAAAAAFATQKEGLYRDVQTQVIEDGDRLAVMRGMSWLKKNCTNQDLAVLFLAGHGENDEQGAYHFLPADTDPDDLAATAVPFTAILATIQALPGKRLAFLDTCHAGNVTGGLRRRNRANATDQALNQLASAENGCVVFAAATGRQSALEMDGWKHGAFTLALIEALRGQATGASPLLQQILSQPTLSVNLLNAYLAERVKQLTDGRQSPTMERPATVPDFPIAVRP